MLDDTLRKPTAAAAFAAVLLTLSAGPTLANPGPHACEPQPLPGLAASCTFACHANRNIHVFLEGVHAEIKASCGGTGAGCSIPTVLSCTDTSDDPAVRDGRGTCTAKGVLVTTARCRAQI